MALITSQAHDDIRAISQDPKVIWDAYLEGSIEGAPSYIQLVQILMDKKMHSKLYIYSMVNIIYIPLSQTQSQSDYGNERASRDTREPSTPHLSPRPLRTGELGPPTQLSNGVLIQDASNLEIFKCQLRYKKITNLALSAPLPYSISSRIPNSHSLTHMSSTYISKPP